MTITQTLSVNTIQIEENDHISTTQQSSSIASSADRTTAVDDIPLENYPPKYDEIDTIEQNYIHIHNNKNSITSDNKRKRRWRIVRKVTYIIIMNAAIPITLYYILKSHLPTVWALVLSSTPTILSVIIQAMFMRKIDSIGVAVIFGFILSVILAVLNGDPKLLLLRESFVTAGIGVICGITLLPIKYKSFELKPVLYYVAKDLISLEPVYFLDETKQPQSRMEFYWENSNYCRFHFRLLTAINVLTLELEFGLKLFYILSFDIDTVVVLSNSTLSVIGIIVTLSTIGYVLQIKKRLRKDEPQMLINAMAIINGV